MIGRRTLLVNPPLVDGVAFTRQGRCQEREEVLGTTKPPYTLALLAALLRNHGCDVRLVDQTAENLSTTALIARLEAEGFKPTVIFFPSTVPTLAADAAEMRVLKARWHAPIFCFGPHASCAPLQSMEKAPDVDGMFVGEPEDAVVQVAALRSLEQLEHVPGLTFRRNGDIVPHKVVGSYAGFLDMPYPAWDLVPLHLYRLPLVDKPYVLVETSRGCPYSCDFCVVPLHQGHKFRERSAASIVDEIERAKRDFGLEHFYLWGDTVTLNVKTFSRFCDELIDRKLDVKWIGNSRADNLVDEAFVRRIKQSGCWILALGIESESDDLRRDMLKRLERDKIRVALQNLRRVGIKSFAFFIFGYPGETPESLERTTRYALDLDPDFVNFYPAVPYPGTELHEKCQREGLLADEDWTRMEYSFYTLKGNGLDEQIVMSAINRARRRFFFRFGYIVRHFGDVIRVVYSKRTLAFEVIARLLFNRVPTSPRQRVGAAREFRSADPLGPSPYTTRSGPSR